MKFVAGAAVALLSFVVALALFVLGSALIGWMFFAYPPRGPLVQTWVAMGVGAAAYFARFGWMYGTKWADERAGQTATSAVK